MTMHSTVLTGLHMYIYCIYWEDVERKHSVTHSVGVVEEDTVSVAVALEALIERVHTVQVVKLKQPKAINIPLRLYR